MKEDHPADDKQESTKLVTVGKLYLVTNENGQVYVGGDFNQDYIGLSMVGTLVEMIQKTILNLDRGIFWEIYRSNKNLVEIKTGEEKTFFIVEIHEQLTVENIGHIN